MAKENPVNEENLSPEEVMDKMAEAAENAETLEPPQKKIHSWSYETVTVRALLKRWKEKKLFIPIFQRLYVWNDKQRKSLLESVNVNLPCDNITIGELSDDGRKYLLNGLQRLTSLMILSNDKDLTDEEKKAVLDYKILTTTVSDMDLETMIHYFGVLNAGIPLAATVKERSKLPESLNNAVLLVADSADGFFRNVETNATFNKTHHHELISMNALLAVSGIEINENKARKLCTLLRENKEVVLQNIEQAQSVISRLANIYDGVDADIIKRSLNANYVGILIHVMVKNPNFTDLQIRVMTNYIFAGKRSVEEYSETTRQGGGDSKQCADRYELLVNLLSNPNEMGFNEGGLKEFAKKYKDVDLKDSTEKYAVSYKMLSEDEAKSLYLASQNCKQDEWDKIIEEKCKEPTL